MSKNSYVFFFQELALSSFKEMALVLKGESQNNVGFMAVKDTVGSMLSGIANVLQSSASLARFDADDSKENITGYTGNSTKGGVVSVKESVSNQNSFPFFLYSYCICRFHGFHSQLNFSIIQLQNVSLFTVCNDEGSSNRCHERSLEDMPASFSQFTREKKYIK